MGSSNIAEPLTLVKPKTGAEIPVGTPWPTGFVSYDILTCQQFVVGSGGFVQAEYTLGGRPVILAPGELLLKSGVCYKNVRESNTAGGQIYRWWANNRTQH